MSNTNIDYNNDILTQNLMTLSSFPVAFYSHLHNENIKLKTDNDNLEESNIKLRKRLNDCKDKIEEFEEKERPKKKAKKSKFKTISYKKTTKSYDEDQINNTLRSIKSIKDIIDLDNKWMNIKHNATLQRLYNVIPPLKELNNMIGLDDVKNNIFKKIIYYVRKPNNNEYLHTVIAGPPGVGKTELAKIYSRIFVKLGILQNDTFIEAKRDDLVGKYLGHTAQKTRALLESAIGGVLFLDEAYSLGNAEKRDSFSKEAIDMINQYLSERKNELMVVIAGYEEELDMCFFSFNPGLKRRFASYYKIEKYNSDELVDIFKIKLKSTTYDNKVDNNKLKEFFKENYDDFKYYGGDVEKLLSEIKYSQSFRTFNENSDSNDIIYKDLEDAFINFKTNNNEKTHKGPPMGMYI